MSHDAHSSSHVQAPTALPDVDALQRRASDPQASVWVGASAGSGKTKVLADRVSRLLLSGVRTERILCLTFTKAAAAEMSIRLTQRLSRWATCADEVLAKELSDLQGAVADDVQTARARRLFAQTLACPGGMRIQTIHGFAQEVLRRFPLEAGLAPHFAVMDEADARALWDEALDEVLESVAEKRDAKLAEAFAQIVRSLGEYRLREIVQEAGGQAQRLKEACAKGFEGFVRRLRAQLDLTDVDTAEGLRLAFAQEAAFDRAGLLHAARLIAEKTTVMFNKRGHAMLAWLSLPDERSRSAAIETYSRAFLTKDGKLYDKIANKDLLEKHPELADSIVAETQRVLSLFERLETVRCAEETESIARFALAVIAAYETKKSHRAALDYDDLIARANALLTRPDIAPWVLYKLDGGIDHILVDESQDTSPSQWSIIKALADEYFAGQGAFEDRPRTLFVVGDEKQSIYSFLKADPEEFAKMRSYFAAKIRAAQKRYDEVPLNVSFRSAPAILRAVDAVFADEGVRKGVSVDPVTHSAFRTSGAGRVEVWPLIVPEQADDESDDDVAETPRKGGKKDKAPADWDVPLAYETAHDPAFALAQQLARQIKRWIDQGVTIFDRAIKAQRPMNAGDVMVLVQTRGDFVAHFVSALKQLDVPVSGVDRMILTQQLAVMDLMALMQFALLPQDDLTLACVLRGPLLGASEEQMMELAIGRDGSLWDSLRCKAQSNAIFAAWHDWLAALLDRADQTPPLPFLVGVLSAPCPADTRSGRRALALRLGPDAEDPIDELLNEAESFGATHTPSLQAFLHWLSASEAEVKREMEQAVARVRITTVHASKGLESPIVILPDTVRKPEAQKLPKLLWDENGAVAFYVPCDPAHAHSRLRTLRGIMREKQMEEYRRLLYVAMTRAADRLIVCGFATKKAGEGKECWYNLIARGLDPLHQDEAVGDGGGNVLPAIVLADYGGDVPPAVQITTHRPTESVIPETFSLRPDSSGEVRRTKPEGPKENGIRNPVSSLETKRDSGPRYAEGFAGLGSKPSVALCVGGLNFLSPHHLPSQQQEEIPMGGECRQVTERRESFSGMTAVGEGAPPWLFAPPPPEPSPPRPLVPSRPELEEPPSVSPQDKRFARGKIIHRLLQSLPDVDAAKRDAAARRFLANPQHGLDKDAQADIAAEVLDLLADPRFAPLFGSGSRAEQPIVGRIAIGGSPRLIAGQVDRLALVEGQVWIVDYKTNRPPPSDPAQIPPAYRSQMEAYRAVLQAIYPQRQVRCFLIWTYTLAFMEILTDS